MIHIVTSYNTIIAYNPFFVQTIKRSVIHAIFTFCTNINTIIERNIYNEKKACILIILIHVSAKDPISATKSSNFGRSYQSPINHSYLIMLTDGHCERTTLQRKSIWVPDSLFNSTMCTKLDIVKNSAWKNDPCIVYNSVSLVRYCYYHHWNILSRINKSAYSNDRFNVTITSSSGRSVNETSSNPLERDTCFVKKNELMPVLNSRSLGRSKSHYWNESTWYS